MAKDNKLIEEIKKRVDSAKNAVNVALNPNDPDLTYQISLGDEWDNPQRMAEALDMHPLWFSRWSYLLKMLKKQREKLDAKYKTWESITKEQLSDDIFKEGVDSGMTANNSKPTGAAVDRRFESLYVDEKNKEQHEEYLSYKKPLLSIQEKIDTVQVVVDAFDVRTQMLIQLGGLLRSMVDNKIIITGKKKRNVKDN